MKRAKNQAQELHEAFGSKVGARDLHQVLGSRIREMREYAGLRQDDIAGAARLKGLKWTRATVAGIETGRRRLQLSEFLLLPLVLERANIYVPGPGLRRPALQDLLPADDRGWMTVERSHLRVDFLRQVAFNLPRKPSPDRRPTVGFELLRHRDQPAVLRDWKTAWRRLWPEKDFDRDVMALAVVDALGEAEEKAAAKLDVDAAVIALAARKLWGRSLTGERDQRVAKKNVGEVSPATLQATRGHITRELLGELMPLIEAFRRAPMK